jgi:hypothetical protein
MGNDSLHAKLFNTQVYCLDPTNKEAHIDARQKVSLHLPACYRLNEFIGLRQDAKVHVHFTLLQAGLKL